MDAENLIEEHFSQSIQAKTETISKCSGDIAKAGQMMSQQLISGHKILCCGNGGSAADCQHFSAELVGRFERERPELPAIALSTDTSILTAVGNDYSFDAIFAKQVRALGQENDILLAISTSGNSGNVIAAIEAAHQQGMRIVALCGRDGGQIKNMLKEDDAFICIPHQRTARIQECHILIIHILCDMIDQTLFGQ